MAPTRTDKSEDLDSDLTGDGDGASLLARRCFCFISELLRFTWSGAVHSTNRRDFAWNYISGTIPREIGDIPTLKLLVLMVNLVLNLDLAVEWKPDIGSLPDELGYLGSLSQLAVDQNYISGPLPKSFANLSNVLYFHMNNNSISGQIPPELYKLPKLIGLLLDNNKLSGQLDNNNLERNVIPSSYANISKLLKLSLRNCNLSGIIPDLSGVPGLLYVDLSSNYLVGSIPTRKLNSGITTIDLSYNQLKGSIPSNFSSLSHLQRLSLRNNFLDGQRGPPLTLAGRRTLAQIGQGPPRRRPRRPWVRPTRPSKALGEIGKAIDGLTRGGDDEDQVALAQIWPWARPQWPSATTGRSQRPHPGPLRLMARAPSPNLGEGSTAGEGQRDFQYNALSDIGGTLNPPQSVTIRLQGNPVCRRPDISNLATFCGPVTGDTDHQNSANSSNSCPLQSCPGNYEYVSISPNICHCAAPLGVNMRLKTPSISEFTQYIDEFPYYIASNLDLELYQVVIESYQWKEGPRLELGLELFPRYSDSSGPPAYFNSSEVQQLINIIASFSISRNDLFGPYDLLNFTLGNYRHGGSGLSKGVLAAIILGTIFSVAFISMIIAFLIYMKHPRNRNQHVRKQADHKMLMKVEGIKIFTFAELEKATNCFDSTVQIGQGGYGKVYKGVLDDGTVVAIKRAQQGSLQGSQEFYTEIEILTGYTIAIWSHLLDAAMNRASSKIAWIQAPLMLVYEFMPNGSLHDHLSARCRSPLSFTMRLRIALGSAKGILYLHTEADPPIIHRDIKANNILLDSKFNAKVSDFGISKLAPLLDGSGYETAHVSTTVKGTPGYLDPIYFMSRQLTEKSDVYSIGIVFLELLTGMRPICRGAHIVSEVLQACASGSMLSITDRSMGSCPSECVQGFMALALKCCEHETRARPTMLEVVRELENLFFSLPEPDAIASESDFSGLGNVTGDEPICVDEFP
ncbi:hypothetical protein BT93_A0432 [Corymbia citriodora subsp. variegata]|nr:hypothetical protein BT93_A0432 [Corymbia citriodora subsp. variegata]